MPRRQESCSTLRSSEPGAAAAAAARRRSVSRGRHLQERRSLQEELCLLWGCWCSPWRRWRPSKKKIPHGEAAELRRSVQGASRQMLEATQPESAAARNREGQPRSRPGQGMAPVALALTRKRQQKACTASSSVMVMLARLRVPLAPQMQMKGGTAQDYASRGAREASQELLPAARHLCPLRPAGSRAPWRSWSSPRLRPFASGEARRRRARMHFALWLGCSAAMMEALALRGCTA
mmetsp:Transcript_31980/g.74923  ORF Transcript_31980/g.74923 Transcript_31980/m.74923 type:complete len:236 (-) Transcript_31980:373-1080(-)